MEGAAWVEATSFWHVRCCYLFLQGFVDQTAILIVDQTLTKDHRWPENRAASPFTCHVEGKSRCQEKHDQNEQDGTGNQPDFETRPQIIPRVIFRGDREVFVIFLIFHESRIIGIYAVIDVQFEKLL